MKYYKILFILILILILINCMYGKPIHENFIDNRYQGLDLVKDKYEIEKIIKNNLSHSNFIMDGYNTTNILSNNNNTLKNRLK